MRPLKILVTGAVGAGKTTFIRHVSETEVVTTEARSDETPGKTETTVALDYGRTSVHSRDVHLFGTPGQKRFSYMWETLSEGMDGMIVLVHARHDRAAQHTDALLRTIREASGAAPFVVGLTHTDRPEAPPEAKLTRALAQDALVVTPTDARGTADGRALPERLVSHLL